MRPELGEERHAKSTHIGYVQAIAKTGKMAFWVASCRLEI
jgi:hypothetical protein